GVFVDSRNDGTSSQADPQRPPCDIESSIELFHSSLLCNGVLKSDLVTERSPKFEESTSAAVTFLPDQTLYLQMAMQSPIMLQNPSADALTDQHVIERVLSGETALYEVIMRRYNQRLYRVLRAILRNADEVTDV